MPYTMIAERDNEKVRKTRDSALIVLANARLMESDGWQVVISDDAGNNFDIKAFDSALPRKLSSWLLHDRAARGEFDIPFAMQRVGSELVVATELAAEERETPDMQMHDDDNESEFEDVDADDAFAPMAQAAE